MPRSLKTTLFAVAALIGLLVLVAIALGFFFDANAYKTRLEAAASGVLGMEVRVGGRFGIGLFPDLLVTLEDVQIRNRGTDVASAKEARLGLDILPLLLGKIRIGKIALDHPRISIEKGEDGRFNFEKVETPEGMSPGLNLAKVGFSDGTFHYLDRQSGTEFELGGCAMALNRLQLSGGARADLMKRLAFAADIACGAIRTKYFAASELKFSVTGQNGIFDLKSVTMRAFDGQGTGSIRADFAGAAPLYSIRYSLSRFHIEAFLKAHSSQKVMEGAMDFTANLTMRGKTVHELRQTMAGQFSLRGKNLTLNGRDLDQQFARYESSQNFSLVDVGAYAFIGPLGPLITKGYDFASIFQGSGGHSQIRTLVSDWKVEHGVAQARDVALATNENRVALQGGLDLVNERFDDVTLALIDPQGCAKVRQEIHGTFKKPVIEKPSVLKSLTGPVLKLLKKVENLFPGGECDVFYAGSVAAPQ